MKTTITPPASFDRVLPQPSAPALDKEIDASPAAFTRTRATILTGADAPRENPCRTS